MAVVRTVAELEHIYGELGAVGEASTAKAADYITRNIGLDCSPRGDKPGFVRVANPRTLMLPDRRGSNRIDSLCNVV